MAKRSGSAGRRIAEPVARYFDFDEELTTFQDDVRNELGLDKFEVSENPVSGYLTLGRVRVAPEKRGQGLGDRAMRRLIGFADKHHRTLDLSPEPLDEVSYTREYVRGYKRLVEWYKSYGFRMNRGRYTDFASSQRMIRTPKG